MKKIYTLLVLLFLSFNAFSQDIIKLENPSFEGKPRASKTPDKWLDCGFIYETAPDIQPSNDSSYLIFGNTLPAAHDSTYLGMVVRDNDTWEMISQGLSHPLKATKTYKFSLKLARAEKYVSISRKNNNEINYNTPTVFRIYGGKNKCQQLELLAETPAIEHHDWKTYKFELKPSEDYTHIVFVVYFKTPTLFPYNGNIMVDNCSDIILVKASKRNEK